MQPSTQDLNAGIDLSSATNVPGSAFNTLVNSATPATGIGFILWTTDSGGSPTIPNPATSASTAKWAYYFWGRIQPTTSLVTIYYWNPNTGSGSLLQWQPIFQGGIAANSITGAQIALGTITANNITANTIVDALIQTVGGSKIIAGTIPLTAIVIPAASANYVLSVNSGGTALNWIATPLLFQNGVTLETGLSTSKLQQLQVNGAGTGWQLSPHNVLQIAAGNTTGSINLNTVLNVATAPTTSNSQLFTGFGNSGTISFTSKILFEAETNLFMTTAYVYHQIAIFNSTTLLDNCIQTGGISSTVVAQRARCMAVFSPGSTSTLSLAMYGSVSTSSGVAQWGAYGAYKITEYL